jgi:hypothetical protein
MSHVPGTERNGVTDPRLKKQPEFFFLGGDSLHAGIYASLVLACQNRGFQISLVLPDRIPLRKAFSFFSKPQFVGPNRVSDLRTRLGRNLIIVPYLEIPRIADVVFACVAALVLFTRIRFSKRAVIHAKLMNECALRIKKLLGRSRASIICEFEGDFESEIRYAHSKGALSWDDTTLQKAMRIGLKREAAVLRSADALVFVTRRLREVVLKRQQVPVPFDRPTAIFPTRASNEFFSFDLAERARVRQQLGLEDAIIILYSGNLNGAWQIPERISSLFGILEKEIPRAHLVVLTKRGDERYILPSLREYGIRRYVVLHPPHAEVRGYLNAADCGLMLRERHLMNEVASPGKFCEYALCGLPLIMTDGIGEYSSAMKDTGYVLTLEDVEWNADIRARVLDFVRNRIQEINRSDFGAWSRREFSVEETLEGLLAIYDEAADARKYSPRTSVSSLETGD